MLWQGSDAQYPNEGQDGQFHVGGDEDGVGDDARIEAVKDVSVREQRRPGLESYPGMCSGSAERKIEDKAGQADSGPRHKASEPSWPSDEEECCRCARTRWPRFPA